MDTYSHIIEGMQGGHDGIARRDAAVRGASSVEGTSKRGSPSIIRSVAQLVEQRSPNSMLNCQPVVLRSI